MNFKPFLDADENITWWLNPKMSFYQKKDFFITVGNFLLKSLE